MIFVLTGETVLDELLTFDALVIAIVYVPFLAYANLLLILDPVMLGIAVVAGLGLKTTEAAGHALSAGKVVSAEAQVEQRLMSKKQVVQGNSHLRQLAVEG